MSPSADQGPLYKKQRHEDPHQITGEPQPATSRNEPGPIHNARGTTTRINDGTTYIRDESLNFNYHVATQRGRNYKENSKASQIGNNYVGYDDTIDVTTTRHCQVYMAGYRCHKEDWTEKVISSIEEFTDKAILRYLNDDELWQNRHQLKRVIKKSIRCIIMDFLMKLSDR